MNASIARDELGGTAHSSCPDAIGIDDLALVTGGGWAGAAGFLFDGYFWAKDGYDAFHRERAQGQTLGRAAFQGFVDAADKNGSGTTSMANHMIEADPGAARYRGGYNALRMFDK